MDGEFVNTTGTRDVESLQARAPGRGESITEHPWTLYLDVTQSQVQVQIGEPSGYAGSRQCKAKKPKVEPQRGSVLEARQLKATSVLTPIRIAQLVDEGERTGGAAGCDGDPRRDAVSSRVRR